MRTNPDAWIQPGATFSPCRKYRYTLPRARPLELGEALDERFVAWIGLNPSIADDRINDPTLRRCINFTEREGFRRMFMLNLFAFRATKPSDMRAAPEPIGPDNGYWLEWAASNASLVVVAWGFDGAFSQRAKPVEAMLRKIAKRVVCLGLTKDGWPRHPLYVPGEQKLITF